ncbi:MAG: hypothetical protein HRT61_12845, partial [Ekhidna sp.]|nr:hypothetical protein [Ekhidna sp.]
MRYHLLLNLCALAFLCSCNPEPNLPSFNASKIEGLIPIYEQDLIVTVEESRIIADPGKILIYGDLLLINDTGSGIHVVDNRDKKDPRNLYYINIPASTDMAVKDGLLYVDNGPDLVVISFDRSTAVEVS